MKITKAEVKKKGKERTLLKGACVTVERTYSSKDLAELLGVTLCTIYAWQKKRIIRVPLWACYISSTNQHIVYCYRVEDVYEVVKQLNIKGKKYCLTNR